MASKLTRVRRALALVLCAAIVVAVAPRIEPSHDGLSVQSADCPITPSEPSDPTYAKLTILLSDIELLPLVLTGLVLTAAHGFGPGELHAPVLERPPTAP